MSFRQGREGLNIPQSLPGIHAFDVSDAWVERRGQILTDGKRLSLVPLNFDSHLKKTEG